MYETTKSVSDASGQAVIRKGQYTLLRNGMHYLQNGQWVESKELIEAHPNGAAALQGPHKVLFARNLKTEGAVDVLMPDEKRLRMNVLGLTWYDARTGARIWIAVVKDCIGKVLQPNQVIYEDAFDALKADVRLTYTTGGLESDVILHENPWLPEGISPATARLQVLTEFVGAPIPQLRECVLRREEDATLRELMVEPDFTDHLVDFGAMQIILGESFTIAAPGDDVGRVDRMMPVAKDWQEIDGRQLLIESVEYASVAKNLERLPPQQDATVWRQPASRLPAQQAARMAPTPMETALDHPDHQGFVIDALIVYSASSWIFKSGQTYKIESPITISSSTIFHSEAVLKFSASPAGSLTVCGSISTPSVTTPRVYLTHVHDRTVGEDLYPSIWEPEDRYPFALRLYNLNASTPVSRLEIRYASTGVQVYTGQTQTLRRCVWEHCNTGISAYYYTTYISELLMCDVTTLTVGPVYNPATDITTDCFADEVIPTISTQPVGGTKSVGGSHTFSVSSTGYGRNFQWYFNNVSIPGATGPSYPRYDIQHTHAGEYYVVVANDAGPLKSEVAALNVEGPPLITLQPADQTVPSGSRVTLAVGAIGKPPYSADAPFWYSWHQDDYGTIVQQGPSHELVVTLTDDKSYCVDVQNGAGTTTSQWATIHASGPCFDRVYSTDSDFALGYLINLYNWNNQLQMNSAPRPLPYVNVACSDRGTVVRIDANTGQIVGEYRTAPEQATPSPSRIAVDRFGNVWVGNRYDDKYFIDRWKGSATRIGIAIGGIRGDRLGANPPYGFKANPGGQYLKPPFAYNTCIDRDGDGLIKTSRGLGDILGWNSVDLNDPEGTVEHADDEAVMNYVRTEASGVRTLAVDADNNLWVGGHANSLHEQIDGTTGQRVTENQFNVLYGGYGGLLDGNGTLWSSSGYLNPGATPLARWRPGAGADVLSDWRIGNYGLGIDPRSPQSIWHTRFGGEYDSGYVARLSLAGEFLAGYPHGCDEAKGVVVDYYGNVWVAHSEGMNQITVGHITVGHVQADGDPAWIGNVFLAMSRNFQCGPTGVAVDWNGKIWAVNLLGNTVSRIRRTSGQIGERNIMVGAVDLTVDLGAGAGPYDYSDLTGFVTLGATFPSGSWILLHDGGAPGKSWNRLSWSRYTPANTGVVVEVRAADSVAALPGSLENPNVFRQVPYSGQPFTPPVVGRYLEVRTTLWRTPDTTNRPLLYDMTVHCPTN